jgi:hypothetical protein
LLYQPTSGTYETDTTGLGPFTQAQLTAFIVAGDTLTIMGVPPGSGSRMALDTNMDGVKNGDESHKLATKLVAFRSHSGSPPWRIPRIRRETK